ncbi:MraY family glycosyltransferase [Rhodopirellula halodulae]|uniref:MraY family glycosyltransferase n=1 Tax=Rhodopirellula halodulae TaxID=2894198 RepID=UPI001E44E1FC|nr:MraY family glycosyltransferase [Rhodopirellula sp. JC737]MCC9657696.1 undecaprenyl/decaprenyl-phosphate alpha-N-acetylglucosaminyl 1-phosphate transferase [Rhodopirellula sp. JC737]
MSATIGLVLLAAGMAAVSSWLILFPIRKFADQLGLLDRPGGHSSHTVPTPLGGGLGIYLGILSTITLATLAAALLRDPTSIPGWVSGLRDLVSPAVIPESWWEAATLHAPGVWSRCGDVWWLIAAGTVLVTLGLLDDRFGLPVGLRLGVQFGISAAVVWGLDIELSLFLVAGWLTKLLSVVWIVAVINSFNMLDNMDTLSSGVAAIIAGSMALVMMTIPDPGTDRPQLLVASLLLVVAGALIGFLFHNRPPAKIFMGDGGSYLVGFLIAVGMLMATFAAGENSDAVAGDVGEGSWVGSRPHAVLAPLCAMAVPLYDMITVIWIRIRQGRSPFQGDHSHLSHRLVDLGLSRTGAVSTIHLLTATCGLAALLLTHVGVWQSIAVLGIVLCLLTLIGILESTQWRRSKP